MSKSGKRAAVIAVLAVAAAVATSTSPASASTTRPAASTSGPASAGPVRHSKTVQSAPGPLGAVPQFSGCGWTPANNSNIPASFNASGVNIRTGADTSCTVIGEGYPGQSVTVRCAWYNSGDNRWWDYLDDKTTGKRGWSAEEYVNWSGSALVC